MTFDCKDLERALKIPELMAEAHQHARDCLECRRQLWMWREISNVAPQLHRDWESPQLWSRIQAALASEPRAASRGWPVWQWAAAAAAVIVTAGILLLTWGRPSAPQSADFLTEQALEEVKRSEAAYAISIEKLSQLVAPGLGQQTTPIAANYREKLLVLDAAIKEMDATIDQNPYNAYLRTELAALYREKQTTLQELLSRDKEN